MAADAVWQVLSMQSENQRKSGGATPLNSWQGAGAKLSELSSSSELSSLRLCLAAADAFFALVAAFGRLQRVLVGVWVPPEIKHAGPVPPRSRLVYQRRKSNVIINWGTKGFSCNARQMYVCLFVRPEHKLINPSTWTDSMTLLQQS